MTQLLMALGLLALLAACSLPQKPLTHKLEDPLPPVVSTVAAAPVKHKAKFSPLKVVRNSQVKKWIDYFQHRDSARFQRALNRGFFYRPIVEATLRENNLPPEFFFIPLIESSYVSHAHSRAQAVGIWQFIKGTGQHYGLAVNRHVDERKSPVASSLAAAKYFKDLYIAFGSWELAMAAYNCGEHRVLRAIMKGDSKDYWVLSRKKLLPRETRNYVPKFMAAVIIGKNPKKFGLRNPRHLKLPRHPKVVGLRVPPSSSLKQVAKTLSLPLKLLKKINPHLKTGHTSPRTRHSKIWVPAGTTLSTKQYARLKGNRPKRGPAQRAGDKIHVVKRGENLSIIARRYRKTIAQLKKLNGMTSSRIYPGQKLSFVAAKQESLFYKVRRGDSLFRIAGKFGVSIAHIKRKNQLRGSRIYPGQKLKI